MDLAQQQGEVLEALGAAAGRLVQRQLKEGEGEAAREAEGGHGPQRGQAWGARGPARQDGSPTETPAASALRRDWL